MADFSTESTGVREESSLLHLMGIRDVACTAQIFPTWILQSAMPKILHGFCAEISDVT